MTGGVVGDPFCTDEVDLDLARARLVFAMTRNGAASRSSSQEHFVRRRPDHPDFRRRSL
jgi:hypothetical protein